MPDLTPGRIGPAKAAAAMLRRRDRAMKTSVAKPRLEHEAKASEQTGVADPKTPTGPRMVRP
jgi:hypothetical protein